MYFMDVETYTDTDCVIRLWRATPSKSMSEWRKAASTVISMTPDFTSYERVFSVLKGMHAYYAQDNILSDQSGIIIDTFQL